MVKPLFFALLMSLFLRADVLVTKTGKTLETRGPWELRGQFVVFTNAEGMVVQLPLKHVDLEASRQATEAARQAELAANKEKPAKPEPPPQSIADISANLEGAGEEDKELPKSLEITDSKVGAYAAENPYTDNEAIDGEQVTPGYTADQYAADQKQMAGQLSDAKKRLAELERQIQINQDQADAMETAMTEDSNETLFANREVYLKRTEELKAQRQELQKEIENIETAGRKRGIRNLDAQAQRKDASDAKNQAKEKGKKGEQAPQAVEEEPPTPVFD
jgi:hypothetical protein